jgi:hypothetical protein
MTLPNFVVIGAPKAGTGSLHDYLRQHPDIYMPKKKDPRFFCVWEGANRLRFPVQTLAEYEALFADARGETAIGESTALYFWSPVAPARMKATIPDARLIVSLREPVQRAFSIYHMNLRTEGHNAGLSFLEALKVDPILQRTYHRGLAAWLAHFDRSRIEVLLFEDLATDALGTVQGLFAWLGVDPRFEPDLKISNPGGVPRSRRFHRLMTNDRLRSFARENLPEALVYKAKDLRSLNLDKTKMRMTDEERAGAYAFYEEDILRTQDLLDMDLSRWLRPEQAAAAA